MVRGLEPVSVVGNHDLGSVGAISLERFNPDARTANEWTGGVLERDHACYIRELPTTVVSPDGDVLLVHGSPRDPVWEYVLSREQAYRSFLKLDGRLCFHGHSHSPMLFEWALEAREAGDRDAIRFTVPSDGQEIVLRQGARYLANAGSVGQPRDGDPRACYVTYSPEDHALTWHRVEYDIKAAQEMMEEAGLPVFLADRLALGR
jgi:diadenosine tetraphosphatase ApaH/serine/threonine PP2A family protein phosphatase